MALSEGQMLGQYRIEAAMGHGGMATVYRATQARLGRAVAIKMLHPAFVQDPMFLTRFEREAQIVAGLDHPHIVPVYDFADYEGQPYLVMKHIDGETLKQMLERGPIAPEEAVRILTPIAAALDYAHSHGVLHRDVKPSNILIAANGTPYLTDFGLARMASLGSSTLSGDVLLGTPHYISPEQALGSETLTPATDIYALGVILYEIATGRVPFTGDTPYAIVHAHIYDPLPAPRAVNPALSEAVEAVLQKALAKNPAERYATATAMMEAYHAAVQGAAPAAPPVQDSVTERPTLPAEAADDTDPFAGFVPAPVPRAADPFAQTEDDTQPDKPKRTVIETSFDFSDVGETLKQAGTQILETIEEMSDSSKGDDDFAAPGNEAALRRRVERQMKKRGDLWKNALAFAIVIPIMWMIFGISADSLAGAFGTDFPYSFTQFPWPLIIMLGWGAGLAGDAIETYHKTGARAARRLARLHEAFRAEYGPQWYRDASRRELKAIRKRIDKPLKERIDLQKSATSFAFVIPMLWVIYLFTAGVLGAHFGTDFPYNFIQFPWPVIVMLAWGFGIVAGALNGIATRGKEHSVERAMREQRTLVEDALWEGEKPKRDSRNTRTMEDGELTDSMVREIEGESRRHSQEQRSSRL